jgi:cell division protein FtsN
MTFPFRAKQQGNTLTGLIIGLIIGLAIAVVVALVITKGSTPFTDKSGKVGKPAEPTSGQISDPNKPLYGGKDAAREANKEFQKEGKVIPAATPAAAPAPAAGTPATPPAAAKPATAAATPAAAPAVAGAKPGDPAKPADAAKPAEDKYIYFLQVGEFRETANADNTRAKLALLGYEATISERTVDNNVLHRVRLGPYAQVDARNKVRAKLTENGIDVAVFRTPK